MYDMRKLTKRCWNVILPNGKELNILSPKIKNRNKMASLLNKNENYLEELSECIELIINTNEEGFLISKEEIQSLMDEEQMVDFVDEFTNWLTKVSDEKN